MMSTRGARLTRGLLIAAFSVLVAALSHSFAGGPTPSWLAIVVALAFAAMLSVGLAGGRGPAASATRSTPSLWRTACTVISVAGSQLVFHGLFSVLGGQPAGAGSAASTVLSSGAHAGHHMTPAQIAAELAAVTPVTGPSLLPSGAHHDAWMIVGHTVAGLLTIAAILHGERALRGLPRTATLAWRRVVELPVSITAVPHAAPTRPAVAAVWIPRPLDVVHASLRHRGPPVSALA